MVLKGVSDSSTEHIQKLVSNQKIDPKKKWGVLGEISSNRMKSSHQRRGGKSGLSNRYRSCREIPKYRHPGQTRGHPYKRCHTPLKRANHSLGSSEKTKLCTVAQVPSYIQDRICDLVSSYDQENGLPLTHISEKFKQRYGVPLQAERLGFVDETEMISSLKDIVAIRKVAGDELCVVSLRPAALGQEPNVRDSFRTNSPRSDTWNNLNERNRSISPLLPSPGERNRSISPLSPSPGRKVHPSYGSSRPNFSIDQFYVDQFEEGKIGIDFLIICTSLKFCRFLPSHSL